MRGEAMAKICRRLGRLGEHLSEKVALEFFARAGDWQTIEYAGLVKELYAWEIDPEHHSALARNLPAAKVTIGDSYQLARKTEFMNKFDFIVVDNPQNIFGDKGQYCEHFEVLPLLGDLMKGKCRVIFNVNWSPFDIEKSPEWLARRNEFYGTADASVLSVDWLLDFYKKYFADLKIEVESCFEQPRNSDYLSYLVFSLRK